MAQKLAGIDFSIQVGDYLVQVQQATLTIDDKTKAVMSKGRPNGYVNGAKSASGEMTVDTDNFLVLIEAAKSAGSWSKMPAFDTNFVAETMDSKLNVEAFGCKFKIGDLLNIDPDAEDQISHKLPFDVSGKEFVRINGVPYADPDDVEALR